MSLLWLDKKPDRQGMVFVAASERTLMLSAEAGEAALIAPWGAIAVVIAPWEAPTVGDVALIASGRASMVASSACDGAIAARFARRNGDAGERSAARVTIMVGAVARRERLVRWISGGSECVEMKSTRKS